MRRVIEILLGERGHVCGTLRFDAHGARESSAFEYDPAWLAAPDRFSIDPALPLVRGPQFHRRAANGSAFHPAIADTEPDGWAKRVILRDHAKRRQASVGAREGSDARPLNALDFLLAVDDRSRVGALRFKDEHGVFQREFEPRRRTAPPLIELGLLLSASRAVETNSETAADLDYLRGRGTSLGGLRPKCTIVDEDGSLSIGKFPSVTDERPVTKGEVLALRLAAAAGITAASARLVDSDGAAVALIRRFDRVAGGRVMYVSAATMLGAGNDHDGRAYTEIVDVLRASGASAREDIEELWRRIAFSILITNVDDHLRNHGFLHVEHGKWRLAPAFDVNPFPDRLRELKTWISEASGPQATIDALMQVAPHFRIPLARARDVLGEVDGAIAKWREVGRSLGMTEHELGQFADAFEHIERHAVRRALGIVVPPAKPSPRRPRR